MFQRVSLSVGRSSGHLSHIRLYIHTTPPPHVLYMSTPNSIISACFTIMKTFIHMVFYNALISEITKCGTKSSKPTNGWHGCESHTIRSFKSMWVLCTGTSHIAKSKGNLTPVESVKPDKCGWVCATCNHAQQ